MSAAALGALQTLMLLLAVWSVWNYTAWATNALDPERIPVRLLLFALINVAFAAIRPLEALGRLSLYNGPLPGSAPSEARSGAVWLSRTRRQLRQTLHASHRRTWTYAWLHRL